MALGPFVGTWQDPAGNRLVAGPDGVSLVLRDDPTTPPPNPTPDPTPDPSAPHGRLSILWHHGWSGPSLSDLPVDVRASLTTVCLGMSQSARSGTGKLTMPPGVTRQQVQALVADGVQVLVGIGGSLDGGVTVNSTARVAELVASAQAQRDALAVSGICWDLEGTPGQAWTVDAVVAASQQLLDDKMVVGQWAATYSGRGVAWGAVAKALGTRLNHWQRPYYDFPEANDSRLTGIVTGDLSSIRQYLARDDQLVVSLAPGGSSSRTPIDVAINAFTAARRAMPQVGWSVWEDYRDHEGGWKFTRGLAKV